MAGGPTKVNTLKTTIKDIKEIFNIVLDKISEKLINSKIHEVLNEINNSSKKFESNSIVSSTADE